MALNMPDDAVKITEQIAIGSKISFCVMINNVRSCPIEGTVLAHVPDFELLMINMVSDINKLGESTVKVINTKHLRDLKVTPPSDQAVINLPDPEPTEVLKRVDKAVARKILKYKMVRPDVPPDANALFLDLRQKNGDSEVVWCDQDIVVGGGIARILQSGGYKECKQQGRDNDTYRRIRTQVEQFWAAPKQLGQSR